MNPDEEPTGGAQDGPTPASAPAESIECRITDGFADWLSGCGGSLAVTTYQAGKVVLLGWQGNQVHVLLRHFPRPMGLAVAPGQLALAARDDLILFADASLLAPQYLEPNRYDALFLPRVSVHTGRLNLHDMAYLEPDPAEAPTAAAPRPGAMSRLIVVNTRFSCLSTLSDRFNFVPGWRPWFVSALAPEDRCHLNGLAVADGRPRYVTALGLTDAPRGWVESKSSGGVLLDVETNSVVRVGFSMPHSPRMREGKVWLLNSGLGEMCLCDPHRGDYTAVCALPGYLRGLCFVGDHAVVGLSQIRERHTFAGLPLQQRHHRLLCGLAVVNVATGEVAGLLEFTSGCHELYDVQFLPGVRRPTLLNHEKPAARQAFSMPGFAYWIREREKEGDG